MRLSIKEWYADINSRPFELFLGIPVFVTAAAGGAIAHVASFSLAILVIVSFTYVKSWALLWRQLTFEERLIFFGFVLYFFSAVLAYYNVNDDHEYFKHLDKYFRFFLIIPVYLLLSKADVKLFRYLLAGAIVSGPLYLSIAYLSLAENANINAKGSYHHITFGDMAMLGAMLMSTFILMEKTSRLMKVALIVSIVCLLYTSVLSQARGSWLALPLCLLFILPFAIYNGRIKMRTILISLILLSALLVITPAKEILTSRVQQAMSEVELFQSGEQYTTSVGTRLAMWDIAINVWNKHPILGTGLGDFDLEIEASQKQGLYVGLHRHSSTHNIFLQALSNTGAIGFVILCMSLFVIPLWFFYKMNRKIPNVVTVCGMVMLITFAVFGLTESWTLRSPPVSVYLLYFVTLVSTAMKMTKVSK